MPSVTRVRTPTIRPTTFDEHIPGSIGGNLKDLTDLVNGVEVRENITCAGVARIRVRFLASCSGALSLRFLRSITNEDIEYQTNQPDDVAVAADTETVLDVELHFGEGRAAVVFLPEADGVLAYCDVLMT